MRRYAIYTRVSTAEQATEEGSLKSQRQRCIEHIKLKFGFSDSVPAEVYEDVGISGKSTNRPEFLRMMEDVKEGKIIAVVCSEISRVSRSTIDFQGFLQVLKKHKTGFISLRENFEITTPQGWMMLSLFSVFAQFEREQIGERTSASFLARAKRGLYNGGILYGYRPRQGQKGYLDIDPQEKVVVELIYDKYLQIGSYCLVAKYLNEHGYKTREYTTQRGVFHPAGRWAKTTVNQILRNPSYIGKRLVGDSMVKAVWEPIISNQKWEQVQALLKANCKTGHNSLAKTKHTYLFSGKVYCSECRQILENGSGTSRLGKLHFYYRHKNKTQSNLCKFPASIRSEELESTVCKAILALSADGDLVKMVSDQISQKVRLEKQAYTIHLKRIDERMEKINALATTYVQKMSMVSDEAAQSFFIPKIESMTEEKNKLCAEKSAILLKIDKLKGFIVDTCAVKSFVDRIADEFWKMEAWQKKRLLNHLLEKIELNSDAIRVYVRLLSPKNDGGQVRESAEWLREPVAGRITAIFYLDIPSDSFLKKL